MSNAEKNQQERANRLRKMGLLYFVLLGVAGVAILFCTIRIMWINGEMWQQKGDELVNRLITVPAHRGNIYSSDGTILVSTVKVADLWIDFGDEKALDKMGKPRTENGKEVMVPILADTSWDKHLDQVCAMLHDAKPSVSAAQWRSKLEAGRKKKSRCFNVQNNLPYSTWESIRKLDRNWHRSMVKQMDGVSVVRERRVATYGDMARCVLGIEERSRHSYTGMEKTYDSLLRGQDGLYYGRRITYSHYLTNNIDDTVRIDSINVERPVINGAHIISSIDSRYQDVAENALGKMLRQYGGSAGCAVLMDIETGYVLACANLTRDTSGRYFEHPYNNVAQCHLYEPGSTFKTVALTAMLNDGKVDTAMRMRIGYKNFGTAKHRVDIEDHPGQRTFDTTSVKYVLIKSSNVGMSELGYLFYRNDRLRLRDSIKAIFPYMEDSMLHLDSKHSESKAYITDPRTSMSDFLGLCYGYANMVSPMQVLTFYNAMGHPQRKLIKPQYCMAEIKGRDTIVHKPIELYGGRPICSAETQAIMIDLLTHVVEEGTATNLRNDTYLIAGKTGTANQIHGRKGVENNNGSFVGFFPADNPKYSCIVMGEGLGRMNGRQTAVVFKEIADCVMAMDRSLGNISMSKRVQQLEERQLAREPKPHKSQQGAMLRAYGIMQLPYLSTDSLSRWATGDSMNHFVPYALPTDLIPDCSGMTARDAVAMLKRMGMRVRVKGAGRVKSQTPQARTAYRSGTTVTLNLSNQ